MSFQLRLPLLMKFVFPVKNASPYEIWLPLSGECKKIIPIFSYVSTKLFSIDCKYSMNIMSHKGNPYLRVKPIAKWGEIKKSFSNQIEIQSPTTHQTIGLWDHCSNSHRCPKIPKPGSFVGGGVRVGEADQDKACYKVARTKPKLLEVRLMVWKRMVVSSGR